MVSGRKKARILLFQAIYAEKFVKNLDISLFKETYQDENPINSVDEEYFSLMRDTILANSGYLLAIIEKLSPKFNLEKLPKIHISILLVALAEILFWKKWDIDTKISINEAIELAKKFSDESGAKFIAGTLGNYIRNQNDYQNLEDSKYQFFS